MLYLCWRTEWNLYVYIYVSYVWRARLRKLSFHFFFAFYQNLFFKGFFLIFFKGFHNIFEVSKKMPYLQRTNRHTHTTLQRWHRHTFSWILKYMNWICWNIKITLEIYSGSTAKPHLQRTIPATTATQLLDLFSEETRDHVVLPMPPRRQRPRLGKDRSHNLLFRRLPYCSPNAGAHSVQFLQ